MENVKMRRMLICTLLLAMLLPTMMFLCPVETSSDSGLVGLWHFDEIFESTVFDDSGYGNDGTVIGDPYLVPGREGLSALHFDGEDDFIEVVNEAFFDFERTGAFTLGAWIKTGSSDFRFIIRKFEAPESPPWGQGFLLFKSSGESGNCIGLFLRHDQTTGNEISVFGSTAVSDDVWHYVFVTYDGSSKAVGVQIYVDGIPETMNIFDDDLTGTILNDSPLYISGGGPVSWKGDVDEVRISHAEYHGENWRITESETLTEDLTEDHIFAEHAGMIIDLDDVTLDLNGHKIIGKGPLLPDDSASPNFLYVGIFVGSPWTSSRTGVTITDTKGGGEVCNFNRGIGLWNSDQNEVAGVGLHSNIDGVYLWFSSENEISGNTITNNERHGIKLFGFTNGGVKHPSDHNTITSNTITGNENGILVMGDSEFNNIDDNTISHNSYGIYITAHYEDNGIQYTGNPDNNDILGNTIAANEWVGIYLLLSDNNLIERNTITDNNCGEVPSSGICLMESHHNDIHYNDIHGNRDGLYLVASCNNEIDENTISNNARHGIKLFGYTTPSEHPDPEIEHPSDHNQVTSNLISGNENGVFVQGDSEDNHIEGNRIRGNSYGIYLTATYEDGEGDPDHNGLRENVIHDNEVGIFLLLSNHNLIESNTIYDNSGPAAPSSGICLMGSNYNVIRGNAIRSNRDGMYLTASCWNEIDGNTIRGNERHGIKIFGFTVHPSNYNSVTSNTISDNENGVFIQSDSEYNRIEGNRLDRNGMGIHLTAYSVDDGVPYEGNPDNNDVVGNTVFGNDRGIYLEQADSNNLHGNRVLFNDEGISLQESDFNDVEENQILFNRSGVYLRSQSYANSITSNRILFNYYGIYVEDSPGNTVTPNLFRFNQYNIYFA